MIEIINALLATKEGVALLRILFFKPLRKRALKKIPPLLDVGDNTKEVDVIQESHLPVVKGKIDIRKNMYMGILPQKIMLRLSCEEIPLKMFYWYNGCDICDIHTSAISAGLGKVGDINVTYRCVDVSPLMGILHNVNRPEWRLKGIISYHCKLGDFNREILSRFTLEEEKVEKLKGYLIDFNKFTEVKTK